MKSLNDAVQVICTFILAMCSCAASTTLFSLLRNDINSLALMLALLLVIIAGCVWFIIVPRAWGKE